ncbi:dihydropteroate synthase [Mucisphaera calidilacus]|uniref:Dihydropteroate synthase n=1 Tax=Mucisphaera calidilacus TaxID=2527982 RepID=A0A518C0U3_9BACT|nr:dihydropteroate synthase [Mucisphaera calidilacus]QDU72847.1 Dihydropteroate synthase [Mucisphaera calidilacus]
MIWDLGDGRTLDLGVDAVPRMMGVLNVTPDSFSDGGRFVGVERAVARGLEMAEQGAAVIDVGGESTRPGAERVSAAEQIERTRDVVAALATGLRERGLGTVISIDTTRAAVAEAALGAGARVVNDVSGGREDPEVLPLCAQHGCGVVLMHMLGEPTTMQDDPRYGDVVAEVGLFLLERAEAALAAGVERSRVVLDPGIGFGKRLEDNLALIAALRGWCGGSGLGYPVMVGASRKRMIGMLSPETGASADDRLGGTAALTVLAVQAGVRVIRVHDVVENRQAGEVAYEFRLFESGR